MRNPTLPQVKERRKLWISGLFFLSFFIVFGQGPTIGEPAPPLDIDRWIQPKSPLPLDQKPVLLFAWSLNCEECHRALLQLDSLATRFNNRFNFVAISNDNPRWIRQFLTKNQVQAIFVTDNNQQTFSNYNFNGLPAVAITTPDGIVRWAGHPRELTGPLLEGIQQPPPREELTSRGGLDQEELLPSQLMTIEISRVFTPIEPKLQVHANGISLCGYSLGEAVSYLSGSTQARMVLPPDSTGERINLHVTSPQLNFPALRQIALQQLLLVKDLKMEIIEEERGIYLISAVDTSLLHRHMADPGMVGMSYEIEDGILSTTNFSLAMLANVLENHLGQIVDLGVRNDGRYHFEMPLNNWETIHLVLEKEYGLTVEPATKKMEITHLKNR